MIKKITPILTFIGGFYFFLEFLLPARSTLPGTEFVITFEPFHQEISRSIILISSMAVGLGVLNLSLMHGKVILRNSKGILPSVALILSMIITLYTLSSQWIIKENRESSWNETLAINKYIKDIYKRNENQLNLSNSIQNVIKSHARYLTIAPYMPSNLLNKDLYDELNKTPKLIHENEDRKKIILENLNILAKTEKVPEGITQKDFQNKINLLVIQLSKSNIDNISDTTLNFLERHNEMYLFLRTQLSILRSTSISSAIAENETTFLKRLEDIIFHGFFFPLSLSMFSLLAFYIAFAAYRSFKVRSIESAIMMTIALFIMLGQIPQGPLYIYSGLPELRLWIMKYISTPSIRAIYFSSAIAGLSIAVRMWLSLDKKPYASKKQKG